MDDSSPSGDAIQPAAEASSLRQRLAGRLSRLATWATATRLRMALATMVGLLVLGCVFASWSYMAHLAVEAITPVTLEMVLAAIDEGRFDDAKAMIGEMHKLPASPELLGGAMFALGVVKAHEAELELSPERQRTVHQLAAKYLLKARTLGVPEGREGQAAYLLGRSQVHGGRPHLGVSALEDALKDESQPLVEIHSLLASALLDAPDPDLKAALTHLDVVLANSSLPDDAHQQAWAHRAETLLRLKLPAEAKAAIEHLQPTGPLAATRALLSGRLDIQEAERLAPEESSRDARLDAAISSLREAERLDASAGPVTRQAMYWIARCHELRSDEEAALVEYDRLSKFYAETPEGMTAALEEADCQRRAGQIDKALAGYRTVLEAVDDPLSYDNPLLSLADLKGRLTTIYQQFVNEEHFQEALAIVELLEPVFGRETCVELRAKTLQRWGAKLVEQAPTEAREQQPDPQQAGRAHLRAAGRAFENLAELRRASRAYTDDLWSAADCYFEGHSFTSAAQILEEYLHHEARRRNAMALLRLGQSRLAGSQPDRAAAALEECIELYPRDAVVYQARLECARAYQQRGKFAEAERLLESNLMSEGLTPVSPEWRDSKFALGRLFYESERYDESIATLNEAVKRYPDESAALLAKYTMARAYHNASELPAKRLREAKTDNERQKNRKLSAEYLDLAHATYQDVQRTITLRGHAEGDPLDRALLRNCYMMQGSVLFELRRFEEARQAYGNVITLYQNDPIVLESFVQVANCWRRLAQPIKSRVTLDQAKMVLDRLPKDVDFLASTNFNRQQWELLLLQMSKW